MRIHSTFTALLVMAAGATALGAAFEFRESASSSVKITKNSAGQEVAKIRTTAFELVRDYESDPVASILLKKITESVETEGLEGSQSKLSLTARKSSRGAYEKILYKIEENSHGAGFVGDGILLTWQFGCCDAATSYRAFHLQSGKQLLAYDDHTGVTEGGRTVPFVIEVPNSPLKRFLGFLSESATRDFKPGTLDGRQKVGTLTYSSHGGPLEAFDIFARIPENWGIQTSTRLVDLSGSGELRANRLTLWASDGEADPVKALNGFGVEITFYFEEELKVTIPFSADKADIGALSLPESIRIMPASR